MHIERFVWYSPAGELGRDTYMRKTKWFAETAEDEEKRIDVINRLSNIVLVLSVIVLIQAIWG